MLRRGATLLVVLILSVPFAIFAESATTLGNGEVLPFGGSIESSNSEISPRSIDSTSRELNPNSVEHAQNSGKNILNPLGTSDIFTFITQIIDIILVVAVPVIVLYIMYGGWVLVMAQGKPDEISRGNRIILWALVGGVLILGVNIIIEIIQTTVDALQS